MRSCMIAGVPTGWLIAGVLACVFVASRVRHAIPWYRRRWRLAAEARAHGFETSWHRGSSSRLRWLWTLATQNVELCTTVAGRQITLLPRALGWRREVTTAWWWCTAGPLATPRKIPSFHVHVSRVSRSSHPIPRRHRHATGDEVFDAELEIVSYVRAPNADPDRETSAVIDAVIASTRVRELLRVIIGQTSDSVSISWRGIDASVRRDELTLRDMRIRVEQLSQLADAVDAVFAGVAAYR